MSAQHVYLIVGPMILAALFSGSENGLYALNRWRLRHRRESGWPSARLLGAILDDPRKTVTAMLIGTNISYYVLSATVTGLIAGAVPERWRLFGVVPMNAQVASALLLLLPTFILCEVVPKNFFRSRAETILYSGAVPLYLWVRLVWPVSAVLQLLGALAGCLGGRGGTRRRYELSRPRLLTLMAEGAQLGRLSRGQVSLGSHVMRLGSMPVSDVMLSLDETVVLDESAPMSEFLLAAKVKGLWRVLVRSPSGEIDGMASLYDAMAADHDTQLAAIRREVVSLASDTSVAAALVRMQSTRQMLAVVVEPEGGVVGRVGMSDLVGAITARGE